MKLENCLVIFCPSVILMSFAKLLNLLGCPYQDMHDDFAECIRCIMQAFSVHAGSNTHLEGVNKQSLYATMQTVVLAV